MESIGGQSDVSSHSIEDLRPELISLAYRMLGSWADAQDVAQQALIRWHAQSRAEQVGIRSPRSWLFKIASRLCLDLLKSARRQRETYVGPWLPEPWLVHERSPADEADFDDSITMAMMLALERLSAAERAAFILADVFDFQYEEIGNLLGKTPAACRKLASRARLALRRGETRFDFRPVKHRELLEAFVAASSGADLEGLKSVLADDVALYSDGGGVAKAARKVLLGNDVVGRLFVGLARKARRRGDCSRLSIGSVNGLPALFEYVDDRLVTVVSIAVFEGRIQQMYQQRNPLKLRLLEAALSGGDA